MFEAWEIIGAVVSVVCVVVLAIAMDYTNTRR